MNYDEFEPLNPGEKDGYYSTAPNRKPRHLGLLVGASMAVVLACGALAVMSLFELHIDRYSGKLSFTLTQRNPEISAAIRHKESPVIIENQATESGAIRLQPEPKTASSYETVYESLTPSMVTVSVSSADGTTVGNGVIMTQDGYLVTCAQGIASSNALTVTTSQGSQYIASMVGSDTVSDLAVLKIEASGLTPAPFGSTDSLCVGNTILALENSLGAGSSPSLTDGIVCAIDRAVDAEGRTLALLQTNATVSGSWGGAVVNPSGQVVGIHVTHIGSFTGTDALGLAMPIDTAKGILEELMEKGTIVSPPSIAITGQDVPAAARAYYQLPQGVYVSAVTTGSNAQTAGLMPGDIITAIDGVPVDGLEELNTVKNRHQTGDEVTLDVYRSEQYIKIQITLA